MKNKFFLCFLMLNLINFAVFAANSVENTENLTNGVIRYAIYIGANDGGKGRERLLYAGSDAESFKKTMTEIGGVEESNSEILINPTRENIDKAIEDISEKIILNADSVKRSEFIFYYSGHSDENSLLLGETSYDYSDLKAAITDVPSDIHVVILDSCYSGNFIRTKGGQKRKPFLIDDSAVVSGHAYLSSSSDTEFSQESDEIESSYFTNAMISGLRGAADTSGDNKVTLNELYSYAFNETLSRTENSKAGPQHPNYNITLVGSGDLVLSDLSTAESMLSLSKESQGRFIIRDSNEKLVAEINKTKGQPIFMALPAGEYFAVVINGNSTKQGSFELEKGQIYVIDENNLSRIHRKVARVRGNADRTGEKINTDDSDVLGIDDLDDFEKDRNLFFGSADFDEEYENGGSSSDDFDVNSVDFTDLDVVHFQPVPAVTVTGDAQTAIFSFGMIGSIEKAMLGPQVSSIMNVATAMKFTPQFAGIFNVSRYGMFSVQAAGIFNIGNDFSGVQLGGLFNVADDMYGNQTSGLFNVASSVNGSQISGGANFSDGLNGVQVSGLMNIADNVKGGQISGFMNAADDVNGVQISGGMNFADNVKGIQIGVLNFADDVKGIQIGLLNFVDNGLMDISVGWNSDGLTDFCYQGGSKYLYTVTGLLMSDSSFEKFDFGAAYFGFGSQLDLSFFKFEMEMLNKLYFFNVDDGKYSHFMKKIQTLKSKSEMDVLTAFTVPSLRFNAWLQLGIFGLGCSVIFDYHHEGWNDMAFKLFYRENKFDFGDCGELATSFQFNLRVHL